MNSKADRRLSLAHNPESSEALAAFFDECSRDTAVRNAFEQECVIDSLILVGCKNAPSIKNAESQDDWNRLLDDSLEKKSVRYRFTNKSYSFTKIIRLAAAACLAIAAGGLLVTLLYQPDNNSIYTSSMTNDRSPGYSADAAVVQSGNDIVTSDSQSSIVMFDSKTAGVVGKKSHMVVEKKDTAVYLSLTSGAVLFTVEKGRYRSFTVVTPHAKIRVTGTTFRVDATQKMTKITVVEGSVRVTHDSGIDNDTITLKDGNVAVADSLSIKGFESEKELELSFPVRKLLDNFVMSSYSKDYTGMSMSELQADSILADIRKTGNTGGNLYRVFTAANTLQSFRRYDDALKLYEYIIDNSDSSELRDNAACYLTWSLIQKKTEPGKRTAEINMHAVNSPGEENVNLIRLFPGGRTQP